MTSRKPLLQLYADNGVKPILRRDYRATNASAQQISSTHSFPVFRAAALPSPGKRGKEGFAGESFVA
jgi:hypothetical protein